MIIVTALPNDLVVCKDNPGLSVGRPLLDTGKKTIIAAFLSVGLMGQEAGPPIITPVNPEAAEAVAAFVGLGRYAGTCAAHLPAGAKARLDGLTSDQAPPGVPTWLVSGFRQGYEQGLADSSRPDKTAAECRDMERAANARMQAAAERLKGRL